MNDNDGPTCARVALPTVPSTDGPGELWDNPLSAVGRPRLRVRVLERTALVRFDDAELFLDEAIIRGLGEQLESLIQPDGHPRLVVNFGGARYLSSDVLAKLVRLAKQAEPAYGRIQLCELDPLLRDMLRITGLDEMFDLCGNEAEALGLIIR
jgi:anti-anti-sigma factor